KQLFNFIDTVERVEVSTEQIESFLPAVYKKLGWMTREELIQRFVSIEFNRFLDYYKNIKDLEATEERSPREARSSREERSPRSKAPYGSDKNNDEIKKQFTFQTFRLNLGYNVEMNKRELMRYINKLNVSRGIEIGQINIYDNYSLIDLDATYESKLLKAFNSNKYKGIQVEASVAKPNTKPSFRPKRK
ncbi:MAG: DbpA RNA binding domain-containing protein, partial [Candidatus Cloacimonetes bacterium]|nr:DbpA RNA binding domain-containing protein [Candidatus Cloacimonadota bacterium]